MVCFISVIDIIFMSILMKKFCSVSKILTKNVKLHQYFENYDQIETKIF